MTDQFVIAVPPRVFAPIMLGHRTRLFVPAFHDLTKHLGEIIQIRLREDAPEPETIHVKVTAVDPGYLGETRGYEIAFKRVNTGRRAKPWRKR